ncbi:uncharacterized protein SCHCODRAFT_02325300 [Schizophyllum commune H4-8]|uniref:uncharacterized protein n=1 Tax=Schizophyllum commune (strain H4-8 / FGSC 9210) TaxID=578458 RepID=UPI002160F968|nr:uncharacterized protein SCHCODRAFT_02325300 [Schizophyllum commune H4-8]KAI5891638.1 hypothetical protein SCHCODRAFT_02325300 [Schizophyllum commune H4-8]
MYCHCCNAESITLLASARSFPCLIDPIKNDPMCVARSEDNIGKCADTFVHKSCTAPHDELCQR